METRKKRSDAGKPRVTITRPPMKVTIYLAGHGDEAKIANAIDSDLKVKKKINTLANRKDVLVEWLKDYLGLGETKP